MSTTSRSSLPNAKRPLGYMEIVFAMILSAGIAMTVLVAPWPFISIAVGVTVAALGAGMLCVLSRPMGNPQIMALGLLLFLAVMLIASFGQLRVAALNLLNVLIAALDVQLDAYVMQVAIADASDPSTLMFAIFIGLLIALVSYEACSNRSVVAVALVSAVCLGFGIFLDVASQAGMACVLLGCIALIACFMRIGGRGNGSQVTASFLSSVIAVMLAAGLACIPYGGSAMLHEMKEEGLAAFEEFRFGSDSLPQGELSKSSLMNVVPEGGATDMVEVVFNGNTARELYLRGFTGDTYTGTSFIPMSAKGYEGDWTGLFAWMDSHGFSPLSQYSAYEEANSTSTEEFESVTVNVGEACRKYAYAPVCANAAEGPGALLDLYRTDGGLLGNRSSAFAIADGSVLADQFVASEWVYQDSSGSDAQLRANTAEREEFLTCEQAYRAFVHDKYMEVDDAIAPTVEEFFFNGDEWGDETSLYSVTTRIRTMLDAECSYRSQGARYDGGDYVSWFLNGSKAGNTAAFAAAAVLAFREAGIPARYVEGYHLDSSDAERIAAAGLSSCTLTEKNAHAWPEVYVDGGGWLPVEVTPGFYDKVNSSDDVIEIAREVAGKSNDDSSMGSVDEALDLADLIPEELRPFAWIGLIILILLIILAAWGAAEAQRAIRISIARRSLDSAIRNGGSSVLLYRRLKELLRDGGIEIDDLHPLHAANDVIGICPQAHDMEYELAIKHLEAERYGSKPLSAHEARIVNRLCEKLESANWMGSSLPRRLYYRYAHLYLIPLR